MALEVRIITGPPSARISKEAAAQKLETHPEFPKGASYELEDVDGRWIAAIASEKVAEFPPAGGDEAPAPDAPAEDAPSEDGPPSEDAGDEGGEEKPKGDDEGGDKPKGEHEKGGELGEIKHLLTTLLTALGLDPTGGLGNPVPGMDDGAPAVPPAPHHPAGPPGPGADDKTHTVHERALKPGEAPPGSTPIGAPAFASVADDHPWKGILGQKRTFTVAEPIGDTNLASVKAELDSLANGTGYRVAQLNEGRDESGQRIARAIIAKS